MSIISNNGFNLKCDSYLKDIIFLVANYDQSKEITY